MARRPASGGAKTNPRTSGSWSMAGRRETVRVDDGFVTEYPEADPRATEACIALLIVGDALNAEYSRRLDHTIGVSQTVFNALAVIDGAEENLTPSEIGERTLTSSATMTAVLDVLEANGWTQRVPNPADRRSVLIQITPHGRTTADQVLPGIHGLERRIVEGLTKTEAKQLLALLDKVLGRVNELAAEDAEPLTGRRVRPR